MACDVVGLNRLCCSVTKNATALFRNSWSIRSSAFCTRNRSVPSTRCPPAGVNPRARAVHTGATGWTPESYSVADMTYSRLISTRSFAAAETCTALSMTALTSVASTAQTDQRPQENHQREQDQFGRTSRRS